jgi:hypothetical protein
LDDRRRIACEGGNVYAALVNLTIDPDQAPAAASALVSDILPTVRSAPGFVAGYWLEPADGQGFSIVLFDTEAQAREAVPPVTTWNAPGANITGTDVRRVAMTA